MGHDDRRTEVAEAAWRVIAREGLDRASMRAIAQELGCSTGVVTHYFRNKEELTLFALEKVFENVLEDINTHAKERQGLEKLEYILTSALPLHAQDRDDWKVWVAFLGYSIGRDHLIQQHQKRYAALQQILYQELATLQTSKLIRVDLDLTLEAKALIALIDGISTGVVICAEQFSAAQQRELVRRHIYALRA